MGRSDQDAERVAAAVTRRRRWTWATVLTIGVVSASALVAVPAIASSGDPAGGTGSGTGGAGGKIVVCESGVVDHGDGIQTSSASADRVADGAPVPEGCTAR